MNRAVDDLVVDGFKTLAGVGHVNVRCRRILAVCREGWWGVPFPYRPMGEPEREAHRAMLAAARDAWRDHETWMKESA
jgi:hypothetical protein